MMKFFFLLLTAIVAFSGVACTTEISADSVPVVLPSGTPKIINAEAKLISNARLDNVKVTELNLNLPEPVSQMRFFDKNVGWFVSGTNNFYKTENGGKDWIKQTVRVEKDAAIEQVVFVNQLTGWLTIQRTGDVNENDTKAWLLKTVDGGKNWRTLSVQNLTEFDELKFTDEKNGWLIGEISDQDNVYSTTKFLRRTADGGATWVEIGTDLFEKNSFTDARGIITGLIVETPEKLKVSMFSRKLFETENGGKTWRQFGPQFDFPPQTTTANFGQLGDSNRLRMARGTWSIEGIYSYVATENNGDWTVRWLEEPLCMYDIEFLSEKEMLAVGRFGENIYKKEQTLYGVVLYSADGGENWSIVYRNEKSPILRSLSKISENEFLAVGEKGLLLNIAVAR
jgi:photosystem II stability/assembly factor-like uncharacterized protein